MTTAHLSDSISEEAHIGAQDLTSALQRVLPTTLVSSAQDAEEVTQPPSDRESPGPDVFSTFAAALGSAAVVPLARAITKILSDRGAYLIRSLPRWFRPDVPMDSQPVLTTTTEFSNERNRMLRSVADERVTVMISRHGKVVAALVPVREGAFEADAYVAAAKEIRADRLGSMSNVADILENLTDEELEAIRNSDDKVETAAQFGVDLSNGEIPEQLR